MKKLSSLFMIILGVFVVSSVFASESYLEVQEHTQLGQYLTDLDGKTLYIFTNDVAGEGTSACYGGCAGAWPPYLIDAAEITEEEALSGQLSVVTRTDGTHQLAYNGMPLYYFAGDTKAGDTTGHEVGGVWFVASYEPADAEASAYDYGNYY
ncbi:MAG: hypothetical protein KC422_25110 [Trueperaceae bacterium]|nr:hypothetical protein [Trueperaceae bacterium]